MPCKKTKWALLKHIYPLKYFDSLGGRFTKATIFGEAVAESELFLSIFTPYIN